MLGGGETEVRTGKDAGPEAGVPKESAVEIACSRAVGGRLEAVGGEYRCAQLHVFTRNYTLLHKVLAR